MKQLYINNRKVLLKKDTYLPFSQKVTLLDDFSIIGLPSTKTVEIPRCVENDEIFGHISDITRMTVGEEGNLVGISFNQINKATYQLFDDSEIISEGVIRITNITTDVYEVELYDKLIDLIETFSGEGGYMSDLDLVTSSGVFNTTSRAGNIKTLNDGVGEVKVLANINSDLTYSKAVVEVEGELRSQDLEAPLTPIQFGTIKNYDMDYAVPVSTVVRSINNSFNNSVEVDPLLEQVFNEVHMNLGKPKEEKSSLLYNILGSTLTGSFGNIYSLTNKVNSFTFNDTLSVNRGKENGNYLLKIPFTFNCQPTTLSTFVAYNLGTGENFNTSSPNGSYLGNLTVGISLKGLVGGTEVFKSNTSDLTIECRTGINTFITKDVNNLVTNIEISGTALINLDYYPMFYDGNIINQITFDFNKWNSTPSAAYLFTYFTGVFTYNSFSLLKSIGNIEVNYKSRGVRTGSILKGQTLFPKVYIKDFLMGVVKYFNLGISNKEGKLYIHKKKYKVKDESLLVQSIESLNVNNFDFSRLKLTTLLPTNNILEEYREVTDKTWGEKVINTGYRIRNNTKEITFNVGIPVLLKDYNSYGYDRFRGYYNGGYSRGVNGITTGLNNITLCYIHKNNQELWVGNDTFYEGGMIVNDIIPEEISFTLSNNRMIYENGEFKYLPDNGVGNRKLLYHYTASPYKMDEEGNVLESLELNKPEYNFAGIEDTYYPEEATFYNRYFKKLIEDIYDVNCHNITVSMWVDGTIDIYSIFNYKNTNYIISNINEYDPLSPGIYTVELLRVKDTLNYITPIELVSYSVEQSVTFSSDVTAYSNDLKGFSNDILIQKGSNFEFKRSITQKTPTVQLVGGTTVVTQGNSFVDVYEGGTPTKYKLGNNRFYHTILGTGTETFTDSSDINITSSGSVTAKNQTVSRRITLEEGTKRITRIDFKDNYISSVLSGAGKDDVLKYGWTVKIKTTADVITGEQLNSNSKFRPRGYFLTLKDPASPATTSVHLLFSNAETVTYTTELGLRVCTATFFVDNIMFPADTVSNSFTSNCRIKASGEFSGYGWEVSYDGTFDSNTIDVLDDISIPLSGTPSTNYDFINIVGNYNDMNTYGYITNYKINFTHTKQLQ